MSEGNDSLERFKQQSLSTRISEQQSRTFLRPDEIDRQELLKLPYYPDNFAKMTDPNLALTLLLPKGEDIVRSDSLITSEKPEEQASEKFKILDRKAKSTDGLSEAPQPVYIGEFFSQHSGQIVEHYFQSVLEQAQKSNDQDQISQARATLEKMGYSLEQDGDKFKLIDNDLPGQFNTKVEQEAERYRLNTVRLAYILENISSELALQEDKKHLLNDVQKQDRSRIVQQFMRRMFGQSSNVGFLSHVDVPDDLGQNPRSLDVVDMFDGLRYGVDFSYNEYINWTEATMKQILEEKQEDAATRSVQVARRISGPAEFIHERVTTRSQAGRQKQPEGRVDIITGKKGTEDLEAPFLRDIFLASRYTWTLLPPEFVLTQEQLMQAVVDANLTQGDSIAVRRQIQEAKQALLEHQQVGRLALMRVMGLTNTDLIIKALVEDNPNGTPESQEKMEEYVLKMLEDHSGELSGLASFAAQRVNDWSNADYGQVIDQRLGEMLSHLGLNHETFVAAQHIILNDSEQEFESWFYSNFDHKDQKIAKRLIKQARRYKQDEVPGRKVHQDRAADLLTQINEQLNLNIGEIDRDQLSQELVTLEVSGRFKRRKFGRQKEAGPNLSEDIWSYIRSNSADYPILSKFAAQEDPLHGLVGHQYQQGDTANHDLVQQLDIELMRAATGRDKNIWDRINTGNRLADLNPRLHQQDALKGFAYLFTAQATEKVPADEQELPRYAVVIVDELKPRAKSRKEMAKRGKSLSVRKLEPGSSPKPIEVVRVTGASKKDEQGLFYEYQEPTPPAPTTEGTSGESGAGGGEPVGETPESLDSAPAQEPLPTVKSSNLPTIPPAPAPEAPLPIEPDSTAEKVRIFNGFATLEIDLDPFQKENILDALVEKNMATKTEGQEGEDPKYTIETLLLSDQTQIDSLLPRLAQFGSLTIKSVELNLPSNSSSVLLNLPKGVIVDEVWLSLRSEEATITVTTPEPENRTTYNIPPNVILSVVIPGQNQPLEFKNETSNRWIMAVLRDDEGYYYFTGSEELSAVLPSQLELNSEPATEPKTEAELGFEPETVAETESRVEQDTVVEPKFGTELETETTELEQAVTPAEPKVNRARQLVNRLTSRIREVTGRLRRPARPPRQRQTRSTPNFVKQDIQDIEIDTPVKQVGEPVENPLIPNPDYVRVPTKVVDQDAIPGMMNQALSEQLPTESAVPAPTRIDQSDIPGFLKGRMASAHQNKGADDEHDLEELSSQAEPAPEQEPKEQVPQSPTTPDWLQEEPESAGQFNDPYDLKDDLIASIDAQKANELNPEEQKIYQDLISGKLLDPDQLTNYFSGDIQDSLDRIRQTLSVIGKVRRIKDDTYNEKSWLEVRLGNVLNSFTSDSLHFLIQEFEREIKQNPSLSTTPSRRYGLLLAELIYKKKLEEEQSRE
ncbi:hypothetical protein A2313_03040 [Candidatus Roizmanbacteria bacterium RIFOXYB2_FULL_41_10]|uniref:Uncharacterized protein n=1 Tax=Candidatus Roizmanbacteria bacterium RIFOXYA1_FULL_41_12 TaxID=1802082 RepID=A0A1F7KAR4_9BACT|nr:MAG: hypothetical protein A2209_04660 [Candidatus Roizmanbacteria bacterium RIFOXYA1_FULL_41_12]OGK66784.1 MAG: hypothetical protein A2377_02665 [Candidatus Roizmanbacteria bacterium RIFOXYB1_FULL_41_27]OGK70841.1 MAG: hypothetical protein A2403_02040 [Candidatus Roizmanbacteria bacterium RIFOXYC1_FULL_41_16]OGK71846.1 MAG: hypothetical protein A2313_03040 [Candidatus Roizmanbacteria bacterium RIFOXYB2_FULL_41_10]OGK75579.1 MAG: hypothetical protein A2575_02660 [Candidatus Roizmanbacteria ba